MHARQHRLGVIYKTNLLSLISPRLETFCQIRRKCYSSSQTKHPLIVKFDISTAGRRSPRAGPRYAPSTPYSPHESATLVGSSNSSGKHIPCGFN
jgi:hypothetical protein